MLKYVLNFFEFLSSKINKIKKKNLKLSYSQKNRNFSKINGDLIYSELKKIKNEILDLLYPPVCGICGKIDKNWLCSKCNERIKKVKNFKIENNFIYFFKYDGIIRKLIINYKFHNQAYLSNFFATIILNEENCCRKLKNYDIIIPVPMYKTKRKIRGYNQTELIAEQVAKTLEIKLNTKDLVKAKNTKTQSTLNANERKNNIKNAYLVNNKENIKNKKIIILDDIYTTGETTKEISRILKQAGAEEILILVIAKD